MQRQYQIRPSRMPDGVAIAFSEEILRTLQDLVPIYKALCARHASVATRTHLSGALGQVPHP